jgi:transcriptional regulator with XRE-family HTH domain
MQEKNKNIFTDFGERLRFVREKLGLTQSEFASKLGFANYKAISRFERGERLPNIEAIIPLVSLGSFNLHWLITGKPSPDGEAWKDSYGKLLFVFNIYASLREQKLQEERGKLINEVHSLREKQSRGEGLWEERLEWLEKEGIPQKDRELADINEDRKRAYQRYYGTS